MKPERLSAAALLNLATKKRGTEVLKIASHDGWLGNRRQDVTASTVGALIGLHEYQTAYGLWALKAGLVQADPEESPAMRRGRLLEPVGVKLLGEERPTWQILANPVPGGVYLRDPTRRIGATPDAFAVDPERPGFGIVQFKSVEPGIFRQKWREPDTDEIEPPLWIAVQAIVEAELAGASWACVAPLVVSYGIDIYPVEVPLHAGIVKRVGDAVADFWRRVAERDAPDPDYGRDGALIASLYREDNGLEKDLSRDNMMPVILQERSQLKAEIKQRESRIGEIENEIKAKLGEYERAYVPGWKVEWPTIHRAGYAVKPTTYRRLNVKAIA